MGYQRNLMKHGQMRKNEKVSISDPVLEKNTHLLLEYKGVLTLGYVYHARARLTLEVQFI